MTNRRIVILTVVGFLLAAAALWGFGMRQTREKSGVLLDHSAEAVTSSLSGGSLQVGGKPMDAETRASGTAGPEARGRLLLQAAVRL